MSLLDVLQDEQEERERARRINGVMVGIVTNNQDPDGLGRVRVEFPWLSDANESSWSRVCSFMAGKDRGGFFLPEVGDEVLVAFENGDINYPIVLGALWNGVDTPPEANSDGKNNVRKIKSRSGHEIIFHDDSDQKKEKLEIHTRAGHSLVLDDTAGSEKITLTDKSGSNSIVFDSAQNSITVESGMQLKIKSQKVEIEAGGMMTIKAGATLTLQGALVKIN